jgi:hypothetical protein
MLAQLVTKANEGAKNPLPRAGAVLHSDPSQQPTPPGPAYKPYADEPAASEPYRPYRDKPTLSELPYEPYKGI